MIIKLLQKTAMLFVAAVAVTVSATENVHTVDGYIMKSKAYAAQQQWVLSQQQAMLALSQMERDDVQLTEPTVYMLIAKSAEQLGKNDTVITYAKAALDSYRSRKDDDNAMHAGIMLINAYLKTGNINVAEAVHNEMDRLISEATPAELQLEVSLSRARIALEKGNVHESEALLSLIKAQYVNRSFLYCYLYIRTQLELGRTELALRYMTNFYKNKPSDVDSALELDMQALHIKVLEASALYDEALVEIKAYKNALSAHLKARHKAVAEGVTAKYNLDKKSAENRALRHENERAKLALSISEERREMQTIIVYLSSGLALLIVIICIAQFLRRRALYQVVNFDALTGVPNRHALMKSGRRLLNVKKHYPFSVVLFDLDDFKSINDTYGHEMGDRVLVDVGRIGTRVVPHGQWFGRLGGEEFVMLLPETEAQDAIRIAEDMLDALIQHEWSRLGLKNPVTASLGVTTANEFYMGDLDKLLVRADKAMYKAKADGKAKVRFLDAASHT